MDPVSSWQRFSADPKDDPAMQRLFEFTTHIVSPGELGSFSQITPARLRDSPAEESDGVVVIKSASTSEETSTEPHDIYRELRILAQCSHSNIIQILGHSFGEVNDTLHFWMPHIPYCLSSLLDCPSFVPSYVVAEDDLAGHSSGDPLDGFAILAKALIFQLVSALAYLHDPAQNVAHRDIKPTNVLITATGLVKLVDFGVSWSERISPSSDCLWPEPPGRLCFDVSSGPYRAPELLFGARNYDPYATDLWSLGALCAEFFTSIKTVESDSDFDSEEEDDDNPHRMSLFNADRGSIGLAWSVFQIRGTPTAENWPDFTALPDGSKVSFQEVPPIDLKTILPNKLLGSHPVFTGSHSPPAEASDSPIDLMYRLLLYPPEHRLQAKNAMQHPWFTSGALVLPRDYPADLGGSVVRDSRTNLADILAVFIAGNDEAPSGVYENFQDEEDYAGIDGE
ncbi:hypothetical protein EIP91_005334 [Steccherinum ochraceum]|uniref:Protein kinase domain-containing protein n=1 Tax=Steccherinum ochraceum TaxID=92696 RepID=A0A4R0R7B4_9APHY|nr:hypothetical protein EIP91_005334 [Steccherinum ochraceum]